MFVGSSLSSFYYVFDLSSLPDNKTPAAAAAVLLIKHDIIYNYAL